MGDKKDMLLGDRELRYVFITGEGRLNIRQGYAECVKCAKCVKCVRRLALADIESQKERDVM